jgi:hypothetical protein
MPSASKADEATTERAKVLLPFGFTERQARFLATVMLHSGVFVGRQYAAFAGITHGQKVHDFVDKVLVRKLVTPLELGSTGRTRIFHVHHKPLYAAIGEPDNRRWTSGCSPCGISSCSTHWASGPFDRSRGR